jgi:hypothetical protein
MVPTGVSNDVRRIGTASPCSRKLILGYNVFFRELDENLRESKRRIAQRRF